MERYVPTELFHSRALTGNVAEEEQRLALGFLAGGFPPSLAESPTIYGSNGYLEPPSDYRELKRPKCEPLDEENTVSTIGLVNRFNPVFQRLPGLRSLEHVPDLVEDSLFKLGFSCCLSLIKRNHSSSFYSPPAPPRIPLLTFSPAYYPYPSPCHDQGHLTGVGNPRPPPNPRPNPSPQAVRRRRVSERMRMLAELMPWKRKMDIATMLSEAHGYVKFLQAQIAALQNMPLDSDWPVQRFGEFGARDELNRQQLLQLLVNSPLLQDKLYSLGLCVISVEQLVHFW